MFISLLTYRRELEASDPLYAAHRDFISEHTEDHSILCAGPRVGVPGGTIVLYGEDEAQARALLDSDPFVTSEFATYELHQFRVGLADPASSLAIS
jgi:uncharacterized protein YciI